MKKALHLGALALSLVAGCSSSAGHQAVPTASEVLTVAPAAKTTACSALPGDAVRTLYGAPVTTRVSLPGRKGQEDQTTCVVEVKGERYTALALHLWHGNGYEQQWQSEITLTGDAQLRSLPYGVEAYGGTQGHQTTVVIRERGFALRLLCGPTPAAPERPVGVTACLGLLGPLSERL